jgi:GT2 family glycosyltransferase
VIRGSLVYFSPMHSANSTIWIPSVPRQAEFAKSNRLSTIEAVRRNSAPRVAVVMRVHDGNTFKEVAAAAQSILKQTFRSFEFLVLDDGITQSALGRLLGVLASKDKRIRLVHHARHEGAARSLNRLIKRSSADYVAIMGANDLSAPRRIERQVAYLEENHAIDIVGCAAREVDAQGKQLIDNRMPTDANAIRHLLSYRDPLVHSSVMYRKSIFDRLGYYNESAKYEMLGETEFWSRAVLGGCQIANIPDVLYLHRYDGSSEGNRRGWRLAHTELSVRMRYILRAKLPLRTVFRPLAVALTRVCG